jgi:transcriptional regulator with XRE-family HTH domain
VPLAEPGERGRVPGGRVGAAQHPEGRASLSFPRPDACLTIPAKFTLVNAHAWCHACANAQVDGEAVREPERGQEVVLFIPLPQDLGQAGDGRPRVHCYRSLDLRLGRELQIFRAAHGLGQEEVASVVGVSGAATSSQWETGERVPEGVRRERLRDLLRGRRWPELRASMLGREAFPRAWREAVRWYRRASREVAQRAACGQPIARRLELLRGIMDAASLRESYLHSAPWHRARDATSPGTDSGVDRRRIEDAAYGLRWLEVTGGWHFDLSRSMVPQLSLALLDAESFDEPRDA